MVAAKARRYDEIKTDDPVAYVVSLNRHRRHMTPSQLSMAADKAKEVYAKRGKKRMQEGGKRAGRGRPKAAFTCACGEGFEAPVWHCDVCGHHWPLDQKECSNCHKGVRSEKGSANLRYPIPDVGHASDQVGKVFGISGRMVDFASKVRKEGVPELAKAVEEGKLPAKQIMARQESWNRIATAAADARSVPWTSQNTCSAHGRTGATLEPLKGTVKIGKILAVGGWA